MTTFEEREKAFEKKFAHDQELKFKAEARRNKMLGEWAAGLLGITGEGVEDCVKAVVRADLAQKGDEDVFQKIRADFDAKGVSVSDAELRAKMDEFLREAVEQIEGSKWKSSHSGRVAHGLSVTAESPRARGIWP